MVGIIIINQQLKLNNGEIGTIVSANTKSIVLQVNGGQKTIDTKFVISHGLFYEPDRIIIDELTNMYKNHILNHPVSKPLITKIESGVRLEQFLKVGKNAAEIYKACCSTYHFNNNKYYQYYANKVTKEGYSVYFINNSNLNNKSNQIIINNNYIKESIETYTKAELFNEQYKETRLVFAKDKYGCYTFLGVYQYIDSNNEESIIFKKISNIYF